MSATVCLDTKNILANKIKQGSHEEGKQRVNKE